MQDKELAELAYKLAKLTLGENVLAVVPRTDVPKLETAYKIMKYLKVEPYFKAEKGGE